MNHEGQNNSGRESSTRITTPLGLKPILQSNDSETITSSDIDTAIIGDDADELIIPDDDSNCSQASQKDKVKTEKALNLHPIEEPTPLSQSSALIKSIDTVPEDNIVVEEVSSDKIAQDNIDLATISTSENSSESAPDETEKLPNFLLDTASTSALDMPEFKTSKWPYFGLACLAFFWIIGSAAVAYGYFELGLNALTVNPIHALAFVGFVLIPACLLLITMLMLRRMNRLGLESQKLAFLNQQLLTPARTSESAAARLSDAITSQMDRIEQRADQAIGRLQTVQTAFSSQIEDVSKTLSQSAERQTGLDTHLLSSKTEWANAVRGADQSITDLSETLDKVLVSFQTRIETTQDQMSHIGGVLKRQNQEADAELNPLIEKTQDLQTALSAQMESVNQLRDDMTNSVEELNQLTASQAEKLTALRSQQAEFKSDNQDIRSSWDEDEAKEKERIFAQFANIDALNDRVDKLLQKIETVTTKAQPIEEIPPKTSLTDGDLRGSIKEEQLSLLPGLGDAKNMLPSLLDSHEDDTLTLDYEAIDPSDIQDPYYKPVTARSKNQAETPSVGTLSSQRILEGQSNRKSSWFKRFGRRTTAPAEQSSIQASNLSSQSGEHLSSLPQHLVEFEHAHMSLRERLIKEQLSPDALIDTGCIQRAAYIRMKEGPFAMSRYVATHLGAAVEHLKRQLSHDSELLTQVHDIAAAFPIREKLDQRDEDALNFILSSQSGREFLLCDAALNG